MFDHPQVLAEDLVATLDHPVVGRYRTMTKPIKFADTPGPCPPPPRPSASTATRSSPRTAIRPQRSRLCATAAS
jgi:crotonobetainyl-CoA:carnitine CoA-transferase CaiB-like acyl-CoA transferase